MTTNNRPLSPHLQVYRLPLPALLSITHRASGVFLAIGTLALVYWVLAIASGAEEFQGVQERFGSITGRGLLFLWTGALFYHLCNGVRHLFWDIGSGFEITTVYRSGWTVMVVAVALTLLSWLAAYAMRGGGA